MATPKKQRPVLTPTVLTTLAAAILSLLVAFGIPVTAAQQEAITTVITVAAPIALGYVVSRRTVGKDDVVEREQDGHVLAGKANELPTDTHVRDLGGLDESV